jgi:hypothetical protein
MCDDANDEEMVERLLELKSNASLAHSFSVSSSSCKDFQYALHDAFSDGFKKRRNKPAEMIARHIDLQQTRMSSARSIIALWPSASYSAVAQATMRKKPCSRSSRKVRSTPSNCGATLNWNGYSECRV